MSVILEVPSKPRYSCAIVQPSRSVQFDESIALKVDGFRPVRREQLKCFVERFGMAFEAEG